MINYSNVTIRISHKNTSHKLGKDMTILGGNRQLTKKGMAKNIKLLFLHPSHFLRKSFFKDSLKELFITLKFTVNKVVWHIGTDFEDICLLSTSICFEET